MLNYKPNFSMPVIAAQAIPTGTVTASPAGANRYAVNIQVSDPASRQLYAMAGGAAYFVPEGSDPFLLYQIYPNIPARQPGTGYLIQQVWMGDLKRLRAVLPVGVPPMAEVVYFNVDPVSFRTDAATRVAMVKLSVLKTFGDIPSAVDRGPYETQLLDLMLQGKAGLFFTGGAKTGKMASGDFTLFFTGGDEMGLSPIPYLRNMPALAGPQWAGHPLIAAAAGLSVPVDIYAQFATWSTTDNAAKPLPNGLTVDLVDYNPATSNTTLASRTLNGGDGTVTFNLTDADLKHTTLGITETTPDLFFQIALGAANPEPAILIDPWDSRVSAHSDTLSPDPGYFEDFVGTRLGSFVSPLQYQIGLGFWQYLINHRPSHAIQLALQANDQYAQPIENAYHAMVETEIWSDISLDFYGVKVSTLPETCPTPESLMNYIRTNFDNFYDHGAAFFQTSDPNWTDPDASPLGVVLAIELFVVPGVSPDSGSVVVSDVDAGSGFTVNTVSDPGILGIGPRRYHPLGGIRQWSFTANPDGSFVFFVRGADRAYNELDYHVDRLIFWGANNLWTSYQQAVKDYVNENGGAAEILTPFAHRYFWPTVMALYWIDDPNNPWITPP
jgi:hypothetical protein